MLHVRIALTAQVILGGASLPSYSIAVGMGHVSVWLPYISATGALPPESCWFSFFTNLTTFLSVLLGWLRHTALGTKPQGRGGGWSSGAAGAVACLGLFGLANWQISLAPLAHFVAAHLCLYAAAVYFALQTVVSTQVSSVATLLARGCISAIMLALLVAGDFCAYKAYGQNPGVRPLDTLHWTADRPGGAWRLAGAVSEWAAVFAVSLALLTMVPDFRGVRLQYPQIKMKRKWAEQS